jgi:hypothetical protein
MMHGCSGSVLLSLLALLHYVALCPSPFAYASFPFCSLVWFSYLTIVLSYYRAGFSANTIPLNSHNGLGLIFRFTLSVIRWRMIGNNNKLFISFWVHRIRTTIPIIHGLKNHADSRLSPSTSTTENCIHQSSFPSSSSIPSTSARSTELPSISSP